MMTASTHSVSVAWHEAGNMIHVIAWHIVIKDQMPIYREQKKQLLYGLKKHSYSALGMSSVMCVVSTVVRCDTEYDVWTDKVEGGGASMIDGVWAGPVEPVIAITDM